MLRRRMRRQGKPADSFSVSFASSNRLLLAGALWLAVVAVFLPSLRNGFVSYDDEPYVTHNLHVQRGWSPGSLSWAWRTFDCANWHPVTWLSHMTDCQVFGLKPCGHHLTSVLFHATNTLLLFLLLSWLTSATWRSFLVAGLFGLHPLHVESVAWVAERKDVLSTFFLLLTLWAYCRFAKGGGQPVESGSVTALDKAEAASDCGAKRAGVVRKEAPAIQNQNSKLRNPRSVHYATALVFFTLGLMSKPMLVTAPLLLLLVDYWPLRRFETHTVERLFKEKLPFFAPAAASSLITFLAQRHGGAVASLGHIPLLLRIENALAAYPRYLLKAAFPIHLSVFYPYPGSWPAILVIAAAGFLIGVSAAAILQRQRRPFLGVGWFWFVATLIPVAGLIQVGEQSLADRYTYIPLIGIFIALAWGVEDAARQWNGHIPATIGASVALGVCVWLTHTQIGYWKDSESLFRHALSATRENYMAHLNLGVALADKGLPNEAATHYQEALRIRPAYAEAHLDLGNVLDAQGRPGEALDHYRQALELKPSLPEGHLNAGIVLRKLNHPSQAINQFGEALSLDPEMIAAYLNLGSTLRAVGRTQEAIAVYRQALKVQPGSADTHNNLGIALAEAGERDEARLHFQEALRLNPRLLQARSNLLLLLAR